MWCVTKMLSLSFGLLNCNCQAIIKIDFFFSFFFNFFPPLPLPLLTLFVTSFMLVFNYTSVLIEELYNGLGLLFCEQQTGKSQNHHAMGTGVAFRKYLSNKIDPVPDTVFGVRYK